MKPFSSLFTKILLCFFLNLALLVVVLLVIFKFQKREEESHSLFGLQDRLSIAAKLISSDLEQKAQAQWPEVLTRYKEIHQIDFALLIPEVLSRHKLIHQIDSGLLIPDGSVFTSKGLTVPDQVINRVVQEAHNKKSNTTSSQLFSKDKIPDKHFKNPRKEAFDNLPDHRSPKQELHDNGERYGAESLLIMKTNKTRYWIGIWVPVPLDPEIKMTETMLLATSDSMTGNDHFFESILWIIQPAAIILLSALLWIPLVRHITKPLGRMTRAAEEIAQGKFDIDISEKRRDEIGRLSGSINHMTSRLRGFVEGQKRFLRDVAHELGSPIARIQFGLGILEQHMDKKNLERLADVSEDVTHMANLVNELLSFSQAEMGPEKIELTPVELLPIVEKTVRREGIVAEQIIIDIELRTMVMAHPALLSRAIANLVRNAVKYGGQAGPIHISAKKDKTTISVEVRDSGPGVPEGMMDDIFKPFFRPETSRDRDSGGVGLGLSIVKTCMDACGGSVSARNLTPRGFSVILSLPHPT